MISMIMKLNSHSNRLKLLSLTLIIPRIFMMSASHTTSGFSICPCDYRICHASLLHQTRALCLPRNIYLSNDSWMILWAFASFRKEQLWRFKTWVYIRNEDPRISMAVMIWSQRFGINLSNTISEARNRWFDVTKR